MHLFTSETGRVVTVCPEGELDMARAVQLRRALLEPLDSAELRLLIVDLSQVTFIDSTVLGVLVGVSKRCAQRNAQLLLANPVGIVAKAIKLTGLDFLLTGEDRARSPVRPLI